jgi:hypothetical protein
MLQAAAKACAKIHGQYEGGACYTNREQCKAQSFPRKKVACSVRARTRVGVGQQREVG